VHLIDAALGEAGHACGIKRKALEIAGDAASSKSPLPSLRRGERKRARGEPAGVKAGLQAPAPVRRLKLFTKGQQARIFVVNESGAELESAHGTAGDGDDRAR